MTTVVTGATGFLGRHLISLLLERGADVRALVRPQTDASALERIGVEIVRGDVLERNAVRRAAEGCDSVFHLAGLVAYERRDLDRLRRANVDSVRTVAGALEDRARLVHVSSVAAIGPAPAPDRPADETQPFPAFAERFPYPATKRAGEVVALEAAARGSDVVVANPGFVLGTGDLNVVSTWLVYRYLQGTLRFTIPGGLSFVDVQDVAAGLAALAERGRRGERYILTNRDGNLSYDAFFRRVGDVTGVRRRLIRLPASAAVAAATVVPWPVKPGEVRTSAHWWFADPSKAERELGFTARRLEETIADTASQYR